MATSVFHLSLILVGPAIDLFVILGIAANKYQQRLAAGKGYAAAFVLSALSDQKFISAVRRSGRHPIHPNALSFGSRPATLRK
jgi:hypothetical protein